MLIENMIENETIVKANEQSGELIDLFIYDTGLQHAVPGRFVLRPRRDALLRDALPRQTGLPLRWLS